MIETIYIVLQPMLTLFFCITVGYTLTKCKIFPENTQKVLAILETWVFCPALSFSTMVRYCTVELLGSNVNNFLFGSISVLLALIITYSLTPLFVRKKCYERGIYQYAPTFGNWGYMGEPLIQDLFGDAILSQYKLFCLPMSILTYTWGMSILVPKKEKTNHLKSLFNAPTVALLLGIIAGLSGAGNFLAEEIPFFMNTLDSLRACMGPVAMLLAGATIAKYPFTSLLKNKKVYTATFLRLIVIPTIIVGCMYGIKLLLNDVFTLNISNNVLFLSLFAYAVPLGLNTVVFPEAYGGNPEIGASMAMISHTLCVLTIPLMYALACIFLGIPSWT